jgi:hypothetical protein
VPLATTVKLVLSPSVTELDVGCCVIAGATVVGADGGVGDGGVGAEGAGLLASPPPPPQPANVTVETINRARRVWPRERDEGIREPEQVMFESRNDRAGRQAESHQD